MKTRHAQTTVKLHTGGLAKEQRMSLIQLQCGATEYGPPLANHMGTETPWGYVASSTIDPSQLQALGKNVGGDGNLWVALPDNAAVDLNLWTPMYQHYNAWATATKITLTSLTEMSGATQIGGSDSTNWAAVKTPTNDYVYVEAGLSTDDTNAANLAGTFMWSGGEAVPGQPLERRVTKTNSVETTVTASMGPTVSNLNVWIIWATIGYQMSGTNPTSLIFPTATNLTCTAGDQLGMQYGSNSNSAAGKICIIGTVTPSNIHAIIPSDWNIIQEGASHEFNDGTTNQYLDYSFDLDESSTSSITGQTFEINTLDVANKFYAIDGPFFERDFYVTHYHVPLMNYSYEKYNNYRDWATWNGQICSDTNYWHLQIVWLTNQVPQIISATFGTNTMSLPSSPAYPPP